MPPRRRSRGRFFRARPPGATPAAVVSVSTTESRQQPQPRRKTVIVLEDNATLGGMIVALIREEGYRALRAWDVNEALRMARDRRPDAIVLELSLAYRDGVPQVTALRAQPETSEAPIIIVTGNQVDPSPDENEWIEEILTKPVDIDRLINRVRRALGDPEHDVPDKHLQGSGDYYSSGW